MNNFKVGDIIIGNKLSDEHYRYTTSSNLMRVQKIINEDIIQVKVLSDNHVYTVNKTFFEFPSNKKLIEFKI